MTDFRKRLLGICGVALAFAGFANAQYTCAGPSSSSTLLRAEGVTEQTADLSITCNTATAVAAGDANIIVSVSPALAVTSIPLGAKVAGVQYTEALAVPTVGAAIANCAGAACGAIVAAANTTQGYVTGTGQVTFSGVATPLCAAAPCSFAITLTNIRVNATSLGSGPVSVSESALVTAAGFGAVTVNPSLVAATAVGIAINGLGATKTTNVVAGDNICTTINASTVSPTGQFAVNFVENFSTAFKNQGTSAGNAALGSWAETVNNTETGYSNNNAAWPQSASAAGANLANSATRIVVTITNIPASMNIYVPTVIYTAFPAAAPPIATIGSATLVTNQTSATVGGVLNAVSAYTGVTAPNNPFSVTSVFAASTVVVPPAQLTVSGGTATAVYEVTQHATGVILVDNFTVPIMEAASANTIPGVVTLGASVQFGSGAPNTAPQFVAGSSTVPLTGNVIGLCSTTFMWPFISNSPNFDTGIAIANTSQDALLAGGKTSVTNQAGTCSLNFFGVNAPAAAVTTPSVAAGGTYLTMASQVAPGFYGYVIGVCQFLYAHSFVYITYNAGGQTGMAMGYLGLEVVTPRVATSAGPEGLNN